MHTGMFAQKVAFSSADNGGGTDTELVAAVTGHKIVVDEIVVSADAAASFFFEHGSTVIFPVTYLAATTPFVLQSDNICATASGISLTYTATVTGNVSLLVKYHLIPGA